MRTGVIIAAGVLLLGGGAWLLFRSSREEGSSEAGDGPDGAWTGAHEGQSIYGAGGVVTAPPNRGFAVNEAEVQRVATTLAMRPEYVRRVLEDFMRERVHGAPRSTAEIVCRGPVLGWASREEGAKVLASYFGRAYETDAVSMWCEAMRQEELQRSARDAAGFVRVSSGGLLAADLGGAWTTRTGTIGGRTVTVRTR